jgi:hypothetical protein
MLCGNSELFAEGQQLVLVESTPAIGELLSFDTNGKTAFQIANRTEPLVVDVANVVRWGNPVTPRPQILVVLAGGGQLVAAANWSGGAAVQIKANDVLVRSDVWDDIALPRSAVAGIVFAQRKRADEREQLADKLRPNSTGDSSAKEMSESSRDSVSLSNGDQLTGEVEKIEGGTVTIMTSGQRVDLPLSRVEAIRLQPDAPDEQPVARGLIVGAQDGSLFYARKVSTESNKVAIELSDGGTLHGASLADIAVLQSLGGKFEYLSDVKNADYRSVPYLSLEWPLARDRNVLGAPLVVRGKRYLKGLGMHSAGRLTFNFERAYRKFESEIAIDDLAKGRGSVVFGVYVQRASGWTEVFTSNTIRGGEPPEPVSVDLTGTSGLTLTVDYADRGDELDYADWLDARLVK